MGFKPRSVVFYDGINDAFHYCQKDDLPRLRHSYTARWSKMSKRLNQLEKEASQKSITKLLIKKLNNFYILQPIKYFSLSNELKEAHKNRSKTGKSIEQFQTSKKKYLFCDNKDISNEAAKLTVTAWLNAAIFLKSMDIPVWFVLQPTASYKPKKYKLDYLMDYHKQRILDEQASFENNYISLRNEFYSRCDKINVCESFVDMSNVLFGLDEPIFIDRYHISANGNKYIAESMAHTFKKIITKD